MSRSQHVHGYADEVQHDGRHVEHVVGPVTPTGKKSMEVAEDFLRPQIDAALTGIAMREFDDCDSLRPEEEEQGDDPQPDGDSAVGRNRRNDIEIENRNDKQQHKIAAPESADQMRLFGGLCRRRQ